MNISMGEKLEKAYVISLPQDIWSVQFDANTLHDVKSLTSRYFYHAVLLQRLSNRNLDFSHIRPENKLYGLTMPIYMTTQFT